MTEVSPPREAARRWAYRVARFVTAFMRWFSARWLLMVNLALGLYAGLPVLAAYLMSAGRSRWGRALHLLFYPLCHQAPERSFFLFGPQWLYSYEELARHLGGTVPPRWVGDAALGYKMAVCQRCFALWGGAFLAGLLFALVRGRLRPLSLRGFGLMLLPMAVDGGGQLLGLWQSTWISRGITGALFGVAGIWLLFPLLEPAMKEVFRQCSAELASSEVQR